MKKAELIFTALWKNKAKIEFVYYPKPLKGEVESDCIHMLITPHGEKSRGWIMNIQDANDIIYGLSKTISIAIEKGRKVYG